MTVSPASFSLTISGNAASAQGFAVVATSPLVLGAYQSLTVGAIIGSNTGGTLNAYLQWTPDGSMWFDWLAFVQQAQAAATITRSLTMARPVSQTSIQTIGSGSSPALAAGSFTATDWGVGLRLVTVSGSGTTVGGAVSVSILASSVASA